jgi:signal transduction histidine kinase
VRDFYLILNSIVAVSLIALGVVALISNRKSTANRLFLIFTLCIGVWIVAACVSNDTRNSSTVSLYGNYFVFFFSYFSSYLLVWFSVYTAPNKKLVGVLKKTAWLVVAIGLISPTPLVVKGVQVQGNVYAVEFGPLMPLYGLSLIVQLVAAIIILTKGLAISDKRKRAQIRTVLNSFIIAIPILLASQFIAPVVTGSFEITDIGILIMVLPVVGLYLSVIKHGLFDIRLAAVRSMAYVLSLVFLAAVYYVIAYIISLTLFRGGVSSTFNVSPINIVLALGLTLIFQPIKNLFDRVTNNIFFQDRYKSDEFYARLSEVLTTTTDLRNLLQRAASEIGTTLKADQAFFFLQYDEGRRHITAGTRDHKDLPLNDVDSINGYVRTMGEDTIITQLVEDSDHIKRILLSHKISLLMPLMHHDKPVGYLALGEQKTSGYTNRDIKVLKTISDELIIAIQNALSVQEVRAINANLEQRIEMATAELRTSNARLKRLDASKDEFLSMASHQLRTPLTSVKGYLSMLIDGDVGKISVLQRQVLEEAFSSSERMVHLIHDFLNVSRLQTGKFMLELSEVNLAELIQQEVKSLEKVALSHTMNLEFTNTAGDVYLQIDDTKIRQVVMNYIDNAIYYSHPDSIITIELSKTDKDVILKVKDTGIGVPKSEQNQLFSKFYRASNARKQRPDGTGVGIFLAKKVVTALGGEVVFSSKEGKGSTFGFRLPLKQDKTLLENNSKQLGE